MLQPLAERLRPKNLDEYIGQEHLVGPEAVLRRMIDAGKISSFILWGPPGVLGKQLWPTSYRNNYKHRSSH